MYRIFIIAVALLLCGTQAATEEAALAEKLKRSLGSNLPGNLEISETPLKGIYEVMHDKSNVFYTDANGDFVLQGSLIDVKQLKNLTDEKLKQIRKATLAEVPADRFIEFGNPEASHEVVVFTDVNCGYCRKLHDQRTRYSKYDIKVRYLLTPVLGPDSSDKATSVWCADDRQTALTDAKMGKDIPTVRCDARLDENLEIMRDFNVRGTPAILLEDGTLLRGYVEPEKLLEEITISKEG